MSWKDTLGGSFLGRIIRGLLKLGLAGAIVALLNLINISDTEIGNVTIPLSTIWNIIKAFVPLLLVISALRDFDIKL